MHKVRTIDDKFKRDNNKIKPLNRKKTYDPKNIINFDTDISEMDTHIKNYPTIKKKNSFIERPIRTIPHINLNNKKFIKKKSYNDTNSITTTTSYGEKAMKKVTFSTVEIIRVEKYKKYNAMNNFSKSLIDKNMEEYKQNESKLSCLIF